jgi:hypothetical protein
VILDAEIRTALKGIPRRRRLDPRGHAPRLHLALGVTVKRLSIPVERLDQRAVGACALAASGYGLPEHPLHRSEVGDLRADVLEVRGGQPTRLGARAAAVFREVEELPDLVDRESERPGAADEEEPLEVLGPIEAVAAGAPGGGGEEPGALVVANRLDVASGPASTGPRWRGASAQSPCEPPSSR